MGADGLVQYVCCVNNLGMLMVVVGKNVGEKKKSIAIGNPWIPQSGDGVSQCSKVQHHTQNHHARDRDTAVIPEPVTNPISVRVVQH